jgi:hypothetical protein
MESEQDQKLEIIKTQAPLIGVISFEESNSMAMKILNSNLQWITVLSEVIASDGEKKIMMMGI